MFLRSKNTNGFLGISGSGAGRPERRGAAEQESLQDESSAPTRNSRLRTSDSIRASENGIAVYLGQIGRLPLLTLEQEQVFSDKKNQEQSLAIGLLLESPFVTRMCLEIIKRASTEGDYFFHAIDTQVRDQVENDDIREKLVINQREIKEILRQSRKCVAALLSRQTEDVEKLRLRNSIDSDACRAARLVAEVKLKSELIEPLGKSLRLFALETRLLQIRLRAASLSEVSSMDKTEDGPCKDSAAVHTAIQKKLEREYRSIFAKICQVSEVNDERPILVRTPEEIGALCHVQRLLRNQPRGIPEQKQLLGRIDSIVATHREVSEVLDTFRDLGQIKSALNSTDDFEQVHERLLARAKELRQRVETPYNWDEPISREELRAMKWALRQRVLTLGESPMSALRRVDRADHHWGEFQEERDKLAKGNLRLVVAIAKRYRGYGLELLDLVSAGNVGLIRAAARFDFDPGSRFAAYAGFWIRDAIEQAIEKTGSTIRLSARMLQNLASFRRFESKESVELGRRLSTEEVLQVYSVKIKGLPSLETSSGGDSQKLAKRYERQIQVLRKAAAPTLSLDIPVHSRGTQTVTLGELIAARTVPERDAFELSELRNVLEKNLGRLDAREGRILRLRFGMNSDQISHTLEEIGKELGLTRERVRQIEMKAIAKLREAMPHAENLL